MDNTHNNMILRILIIIVTSLQAQYCDGKPKAPVNFIPILQYQPRIYALTLQKTSFIDLNTHIIMKHTSTRPRTPRFDREWTEMINLLPEHRREILTKAIREYQSASTEPAGLEGAEMMAFLLIKKIVDRRTRQRNARLRRKEAQTARTRPARHKAETPPTDHTTHPEPQPLPQPQPNVEPLQQQKPNAPQPSKTCKKPDPHKHLRRLIDSHRPKLRQP